MQNRELLIAEQLIRDKIKVLFEAYMQNEDQRLIEESLLREFISNKVKKAILSEKNKLPPHSSTAINYLRRSFKEFIGQLEDDYKELQTNSIQRDSFRDHIINAVENMFDRLDAEPVAPKKEQEPEEEFSMEPEAELTEDDNELEPLSRGADTSTKIDIGRQPKNQADDKPKEDPADKEKEDMTLPGRDLTGRDRALEAFNDYIKHNLEKEYASLYDQQDKETFRRYAVDNLGFYMDDFESELGLSADRGEVSAEPEMEMPDVDVGEPEPAPVAPEDELEL